MKDVMDSISKMLYKKALGYKVKENVEEFIVEEGYDPVYGARPLKRFVQKHVETLAAKLILADQVKANDVIVIDVDDANEGLVAQTKEK